MAQRAGKTTTDHEEIRRWAEARGGKPAEVERTARGRRGSGILRLDFPGYSGAGSLREISWDDWFRKFDESNLALVYQEQTARGEPSSFNKLVGRESPGSARRSPRRSPPRSRAKAGAKAKERATPRRAKAGTKTGMKAGAKAGAKGESAKAKTPTRKAAPRAAANGRGTAAKKKKPTARRAAAPRTPARRGR